MGQYFADTYAGMTSGQSLYGRTASDGVSVYASTGVPLYADGAGAVYSGPGGGAVTWITNSASATANQVVTFSFVYPSGGVAGATCYIGVAIKQDGIGTNPTQPNYLCCYMLSSVPEVVLTEYVAYGGYGNQVTKGVGGVASTINCTLTVSAGTATLVMTGGVSATLTLPLTVTSAVAGNVGIYAYTPASGGPTATTGWHLGPIAASTVTTPATKYILKPARFFYGASATTTTPGQASRVPVAWYVPAGSCGYQSDSQVVNIGNNGVQAIVLDGVAPAGGFTWTPSVAGSFLTATGATASAITIPAGSDAAIFGYVPPAGATSNITLAGTNNAGLAGDGTQSLPIAIAPKACLINGDSISDPTGYSAPAAQWANDVQSSIGPGWLVKACGRATAALDDGTNNLDYNIRLMAAATSGVCHDAARTQEALILWGGTNDITGGASASTVFARLQAIVANSKAAGWKNIAVMTCISRNWGANQTANEATRQSFNSLVRAAYGASGADPTVAVLDVGNDPYLGQPTSYSNTTYFADGVHPATAAGGSLISGTYVVPYLQSLPATQGVGAAVLADYHRRRRAG